MTEGVDEGVVEVRFELASYLRRMSAWLLDSLIVDGSWLCSQL